MIKLDGMNYHRFDPVDLEVGSFLADELETLKASTPFLVEMAWSDEKTAYCQTAWMKGQPWMVGGYWTVSAGVMQVFLVPSLASLATPLKLVRSALAWLKSVQDLDCHRIQTYSLPIPRIDAWMRTLGFTCEGTLRSYTKEGQDYRIWSKVRVNGIWR